MTVETIPIPTERVSREESFTTRVADLYAWPDQELTVHFEYNPLRERWVWWLEHARLGKLFPKSTATLDYRYGAPDMEPYMTCQFISPYGTAEAVTTDTLGDSVILAVYPGPLGGEFHPDSEITDEQADRLLNRQQWRAVR